MTPTVVLYAAIGGILPALTWLWFWLREDATHPEPKWRIALTFVGGMAAVLAVLPLETRTHGYSDYSLAGMFVLWAFFEETAKFVLCYFTALSHKDVDEPIDPVIYLITAALGFAAMENTLFLVSPLTEGSIIDTIVTGNLRFVGASLLHVISSATIGIFMALSFYKRRIRRTAYLLAGIITAVALHTLFNLFIIRETEKVAFVAFGAVWIAIIVLMVLFEKVKTINPRT